MPPTNMDPNYGPNDLRLLRPQTDSQYLPVVDTVSTTTAAATIFFRKLFNYLKGKVFDPGRKSPQITMIIHLKFLYNIYQQTRYSLLGYNISPSTALINSSFQIKRHKSSRNFVT